MDKQQNISAQRIIVVDDNVDAAESLSLLLSQDGHTVRMAFRGPDALTLAQSFRPEVMILDLGMPDMDGYAVARAIRADAELAHIRLIALSGYGQPEDRHRTSEVGFDAHLVKPIEPDELNALLAVPRDERANGQRSAKHGEAR
jgi:CheY-like chemotaxis protein